MKYSPSDFKGMLIPFHEITGDVLESCPQLKRFDEFKANVPDKDKIIKYIGFVYDKGSPLPSFDDIVNRKIEAAILAGYEFNKDGSPPKGLDKVFRCEITEINRMIVRYCILQKSRKYLALVANSEVLHEAFGELMGYEKKTGNKKSGIADSDEKINLLKKINKLTDETDELQKQFLNDESKGLNEVLFIIIENNKINLTPEDFSLTQWSHPIINGTKEEQDTEEEGVGEVSKTT